MILKIGDKLIREDAVVEIDPSDDGGGVGLYTESSYQHFTNQDADDLRAVASDPVYRAILFGIPIGFPAVNGCGDYVDGHTIDVNRLAELLRERNSERDDLARTKVG